MSFSVRAILYAFALLATAIATLGPTIGIGVASATIVLWFSLGRSELTRLRSRLLFLFSVFGLLFLVVPILSFISVNGNHVVTDIDACKNYLRGVAIALSSYRDAKGTLPPPYTVDATGQPLVSWRAVLLPYLEISGLPMIKPSKSWTDPANTAAASIGISEYSCPSDPRLSNDTQYFAIVDPRTVWGDINKASALEGRRASLTTIMLIEDHRPTIKWAEPRDLSFAEALELLTTPTPPENGHPSDSGLFYQHIRGINVAFEDGHVGTIYPPLSRELASAMLTAGDEKHVDPAGLANATNLKLDYARCYAFGVLLVLSVTPAATLKRMKQKPTAR